uniref:aquaporin n=1 Tax=Escherichia coli TaxID=562 RepID=UPI0020234764
HGACVEQDDKGWDARKRAYCLKIQPATGSFARNLIYSTKPHLISIPVTNTSVNPARSTAVAIFQGGWALEQLWFFWVVPIVGGIIGGLIYRTLLEKRD